ncbi:sensor histidine kinase [Streptococcus hyovaginalis]|uniref:sensor histidine kinase n=1 Tax=Streptococcus hyovaginalis TaxID=149015 RepID=UPI00147982EE|nr:HAMP domain-containing sensor histidine kinase [Streptococcus hyovaginalis]
MGIVRKSFVTVTTIIIASSALILALVYYAAPIYYNQAKKQHLRDDFLGVRKQLDGLPEAKLIQEITRLDKQTPNILLSLVRPDQVTIYPTSDDEGVRIAQETEYLAKGNFDEIGSWTELITSKEGQKYYLFAEYGFYSLSSVSQTLVTFYPFIILFIFLLAITVAFIYSRVSTKRLSLISETTRQMQSLEPGIACPIIGRDEVAVLAQDINNLYEKLQSSIGSLRLENERAIVREKEQSDFLRMTSHELKTPIASMLGLIEGMLYNVGPFKDHETYLKQCRDILTEQADLVHSILDATNLDMGLTDSKELIQLDNLIEQSLTSYQGWATVKNYSFTFSLEPTTIKGNKTYLIKAIKNILDNAFRYSSSQGSIHLSLKNQQLIIENQVEQLLSQEELAQIFRPFYRPDYSRNKDEGGTGIGLFLVQQILEKHGFNYAFQPLNANTMQFLIDFNQRE